MRNDSDSIKHEAPLEVVFLRGSNSNLHQITRSRHLFKSAFSVS